MQETNFIELERLFLALGDKTRLRLLALMADGEVPVGFLADRLGESQPKVSRHLAYLRSAGVVDTRRDGKWIYYNISYPHDRSQRRMLETVIRLITVERIDGEEVSLESADTYAEDVSALESDIFAQTDVVEREDTYREPDENHEQDFTEETADEGSWQPEEMDVFLL